MALDTPTDPNRPSRMRATGAFLGRVWRLTYPYFNSEQRWRARLLLAVIVGLTLGQVFINVRLNDWGRRFFEGLQNKDAAGFLPLFGEFTLLAIVFIIAAVYRLYLRQMLEIEWRAWMTRRLIGGWLDHQVFYRLELQGTRTDNPDQRIAEDLRYFTNETLALSLGLLGSVVTLVSFVGILWTISGPLAFSLAGLDLEIPGYMVWVALIYAALGSVFTHLVGRRLIPLNFEQQRREADFRFGLVRLRENAEGVALYKGEGPERTDLVGRFERVRANWWEIMRYTKRLTFYTTGYAQVAIIFPYLVAAPRYFAGEFSLGVLNQVVGAFGQVEGTLSWFVNTYGTLADWRATVDRLLTFQDALDRLGIAAGAGAGPEVVRNGAGALAANGLTLALPNGRPVVANASFEVQPGDRLLVRGPTGSGKSTLFRALAGIWPFGSGCITVPAGARILFLPQRPYLPIASLRDVVTYPAAPGTYDDTAVRTALSDVGLARIVDQLDVAENWSLRLSGGEQQRLAIARALLQQPEWLFLDEATSSVDAAGEDLLYAALLHQLPRSTIVSIAHHERLAAYHPRQVTLVPAADGGPATFDEVGATPGVA